MKHILTTAAILLTTATAINAQTAGNQTLEDAISDAVIPYIQDQENTGLSVDPEGVVSLAAYAAAEWNEDQEGTAVAQNAQLTADLNAAQLNVKNLTNQFNQSQEYLSEANANIIVALQAVVDKQAEYDDLLAEYHATEEAYEFKIDNLEDDIDNANEDLKEANTILGEKLIELATTKEELNTANTNLSDAQLKLISAEAQVGALEVTLGNAADARDEAIADLTVVEARIDAADNRPYQVMGNVLQVSKDNNTYSGNSYDIGKISSSTVSEATAQDYTEVGNIRIKGKYSEFNIATDLRLSNNSGNLAEFNSVIAEVKNAMYNEGYKDGYNDGFEDGYNVGYKDAVSDIKGN